MRDLSCHSSRSPDRINVGLQGAKCRHLNVVLLLNGLSQPGCTVESVCGSAEYSGCMQHSDPGVRKHFCWPLHSRSGIDLRRFIEPYCGARSNW